MVPLILVDGDRPGYHVSEEADCQAATLMLLGTQRQAVVEAPLHRAVHNVARVPYPIMDYFNRRVLQTQVGKGALQQLGQLA